jgi:3-deoxy-D-manno-octulosonic-acid transferase
LSYVLNVGYLLLLLLASPWLLYQAICHGKYRSGWAEKLAGRVTRPADCRPCVWFHAVSVGEVQLLATLLPACQRHWPHLQFYVTTTTRTGLEVARRSLAEWTVSYAPLDLSWAVAEALRRIRPRALVLVELEIWPQLIRQARQQGVSVAIVNARMSDRSYRGYRRLRPLSRRLFGQIDLVAAQTDGYARRFRSLGVAGENVSVTGSLKFDGAKC